MFIGVVHACLGGTVSQLVVVSACLGGTWYVLSLGIRMFGWNHVCIVVVFTCLCGTSYSLLHSIHASW